MVVHMDPIANVFAAPINGNWPVAERRAYDSGDELFGKLIRPVIVRATRHDDRQFIGSMPRPCKVIGCGFAGGVW